MMLMCFIQLLDADLPWTYLLFRSIILPPLSLILYLTILSSFYFERCSHIVVLSSSPASWLAQCGFGCLEFCVCLSQSVTSCASLTLREAGTCPTRSCIYCFCLHACTICSVASLLLFLVRAFVRLCALMDGMKTPPGIPDCNQSYYTGNSFSVPHSAQQSLQTTPCNVSQDVSTQTSDQSDTLSCDVAVQTSFYGAPTLSLDAAALTATPSTLSQHVSTQMGSRSASSFSVDTSVQITTHSAVLLDAATQLDLTEFLIGWIYSDQPVDRRHPFCQSPPSILGAHVAPFTAAWT